MEEAASAGLVAVVDLKTIEDRLVRLAKYFLHHDESDSDFQKALATKEKLLEQYPEKNRKEAWTLFVNRAGGNGGYAAMTLPAMLISLNNRLSPQELVNVGVFYRDLFSVQKYEKFRDIVWQTKIRHFLMGFVNAHVYNTNDEIRANNKLVRLPANAGCDHYKHALRELIFNFYKHKDVYSISAEEQDFYKQLHNIYLFLGGNLSLDKIKAGAKEEHQRQRKMDKQVNAGIGFAACGVMGDGALALSFYCCATVTPPLWVYAPLAVVSAAGLGGACISKINRNHPVISSCWNPATPIQHYRWDKKVEHPVFVQMVDSSVKAPVEEEQSIFARVKTLFFCCTDAANSGESRPLLDVNTAEHAVRKKAI